jgi:hypothetical protein
MAPYAAILLRIGLFSASSFFSCNQPKDLSNMFFKPFSNIRKLQDKTFGLHLDTSKRNVRGGRRTTNQPGISRPRVMPGVQEILVHDLPCFFNY